MKLMTFIILLISTQVFAEEYAPEDYPKYGKYADYNKGLDYDKYEDSSRNFLKAEYLFLHQPIKIHYKRKSSTLVSLSQKNGVAFYLVNSRVVTPVIGINNTDKVESVFFSGKKKNQLIILTSSKQTKEQDKHSGTAYRVTAFTISINNKGFIQLTKNPDIYPEWSACFEGVEANGSPSECKLKDAASIRKFIQEKTAK